MKVDVGGTSLAFDVEGAWLVPVGAWMVERPTVIVLGSGREERAVGSALADLAQVVYLDHRDGADDIAAFCAALEIERPVLVGMGSSLTLAEKSAARHQELVRGLVLVGAGGPGPLPAGLPVLTGSTGDLDAVRRFVQAFQSFG